MLPRGGQGPVDDCGRWRGASHISMFGLHEWPKPRGLARPLVDRSLIGQRLPGGVPRRDRGFPAADCPHIWKHKVRSPVTGLTDLHDTPISPNSTGLRHVGARCGRHQGRR
ncbi:hypothetical protein CHELA40_12154 [Chelatococcus asaccharovorans]|nr:hypothetical protein CHELA40_12154 [Chelatococcus asaccharovorans]